MSEEKEYFGRFYNLTLIPAPIWAVAIGLAVAAVFYAGRAMSTPLFVVQDEKITITLYDEPCELDAVKNLPYKATWTEGGKTFQGCFAPRADAELIVAYWDDKTIALIPFQVLKKLSSV